MLSASAVMSCVSPSARSVLVKGRNQNDSSGWVVKYNRTHNQKERRITSAAVSHDA